ncbi:hypothetical protein PINS_up019886 [Pythium insidiosum]|nr:hypothetical protein PINS_up019886 [Pythium insidiosum]
MFRSSQFTSDVGLGRIALAAFALGFVLALHLALLVYTLAVADVSQSDTWACVAVWSVYASALCFFHLAEFMVTASFKPSIVSYESFLLNHSKEYHIALLASAAEFALESLLAPSFKVTAWSLTLGLGLVVFGQIVRVGAMWTAASNFSHRIESCSRTRSARSGSPSSRGASFADRIPYEEDLLLQFFPEEYPSYRRRTISGVPFVA